MNKIKITYRGWAGHFVCGHRCLFRLNTLLEYGRKRIIVSTVGALPDPLNPIENKKRKFTIIGLNRHYETMAFHACKTGEFWEADVQRQIYFDSPWSWPNIEDEARAQSGHEVVVVEISKKLEAGLL